ncbi:MAG: EamA family transporter [Cyanobacteria bacterium J06641_5]
MPAWRSPWALVAISPFFFWGSAMVAMKGVLPLTTPYFVASLRLIPAGGLVLIVAAFLGRAWPRGWRAWGWIGAFALMDGTLFQGFLAQGLTRTGAGLGSVLIDSQPLAIALLARWLFREAIGPWGWLGLALGIVGIGCIGLPPAWFSSEAFSAGIDRFAGGLAADGNAIAFLQTLLGQLFDNGAWLMLLAALSMAVGTVLIRYVSNHADVVMASGWHMVLGGLPLLALSGWTETEQWQQIDLPGWLAIAYTSVFGGAVAYGVFFYFAATRNLTSFSSLTFLTPIFALLLGYSFLGETLTPLQWTGVAITLASVYLINQRQELATKWRSLTDNTAEATTLPPEVTSDPDRAN